MRSMHEHDLRRRIAICIALALVAGASPAFAQTASQITPPTFEPKLQKEGRGIIIPESAGQAAPKGAEKLRVRVGGVAIEGGLAVLSAEEQTLRTQLSGKTVTAAELFAAANRLEQAYAARGYGLVRVVLPAQRLTNGATLKLVVIDGFIEEIDTSHLPANIKARVDRVLARLAGRKGITSVEIERQLLLAGDLPGTVLRSTISRGRQRGGSVLTIEARYKPITGNTSIDNSLSDQLGRYSVSNGLNFNSILGLGETIYLRSSGTPVLGTSNGFFSNDPRNRSLAGGVILPLGTDGLTLNLEGTLSRTTPAASSSGLIYQSDFSRFSARLAYPLFRSREFTLNFNGVFDAQDENVTLVNTSSKISQDRLRILRTGPDFAWYLPGNALVSGSVTGSFGLNGLGARTLGDATASGLPLSRQGADAGFQKLDAELGFRDPIAEHLTFDIRAKAQTSFGKPLLNSEQFGLAAANGLSSFAVGSVQGDTGFVVRAEAQFPFTKAFDLPFALPEIPAQQGTGLPSPNETSGAVLVSPYLFAAYGGVQLYNPTALEKAWTTGAVYGAGVRLGAAEKASFNAASLSFEYGRTATFGNGADQNRFALSLTYNF